MVRNCGLSDAFTECLKYKSRQIKVVFFYRLLTQDLVGLMEREGTNTNELKETFISSWPSKTGVKPHIFSCSVKLKIQIFNLKRQYLVIP